MTVAKRGTLPWSAILVHVTVIRATTGTPRPFNDFYPTTNVYMLGAKFRECVCVLMQGTVIISSHEIRPTLFGYSLFHAHTIVLYTLYWIISFFILFYFHIQWF